MNCSPILKWPGGKRELLPHILPLVSKTEGRYFEPFVGGGAVFFALGTRRATIADFDSELINCYEQVRDNVDKVIRALRRLENNESSYYRIRSQCPRAAEARAARLIYLSALSFNGIYRKNLKGEFNVPYGYKTYLDPCDDQALKHASDALRSTKVLCGDFETVLKPARPEDVIYLDPPYTVAHGHNGFLKYNAKIFSWSDQVRLARVANELRVKGCEVIVSNADHPSIRALYKPFRCKVVERPSRIAASAAFRCRVTECLFHSR